MNVRYIQYVNLNLKSSNLKSFGSEVSLRPYP